MNKPKFKVEHVEEALRASGGVVSDAAQKLAEAYGSCSPASVRNYIRRHKSLQRVVDEVIESNLDSAESALLKAITQGNMTAVIFYLKTKGRDRGYVERFGNVDKNYNPVDGPTHVVILPDNGRHRPAPPEEGPDDDSDSADASAGAADDVREDQELM